MPPTDAASASIHRMFAAIARPYDRMNHLLSLGIDRAWRRRTVQLVPPTANAPILDVCTGTADLALAYWRAGKGQIPIVGADFCRPMLAIARQKCRRAGADGAVELVEADARYLPFPDDRFQIVTVAFGLRNVRPFAAGLAEMVRVCRAGGRVAVLDFSMPRRWWLRGPYRFYFHRVLPRVGQLLARNPDHAYGYLPASVDEFPAGEAMAEQLRAAGLHSVAYYPFTCGIATLYVGEK